MVTATPTASDVWSGATFLEAVGRAAEVLTAHRDRVNALNVFPVPDGDTGTNLSLTLRAAVDTARAACGPDSTVAEVADRIAHGALLGARGNSGVILSQILRGFARGLEGDERMDGRSLARALAGARDAAYKAVLTPVEGTMLTVIRVAAERADAASVTSSSIGAVLEAAIAGACEALADTPNLLDVLRQAGVVDAGGQGVVLFLDSLRQGSNGEISAALATALAYPPARLDLQVTEGDLHDGYGYCTNFMIFGAGMPFEQIRTRLAEMGESAVIVGDEATVKVHLHTEDPGAVLAFAVTWGELDQIKIDNMNAQTRRLATPGWPAATPSTTEQAGVGVVAVAAGAGIVEVLRSLGATAIVPGGQTMNPSVRDLLEAVEAAPQQEIVLLPNNGNIVMAASQVPELTAKRLRIVPTRSVAQGLAALTAFLPDKPLADIAEAMEEAMASVRAIEITYADRDATFNELAVRKGQVIGLLDDALVAAGDDLLGVAVATLERAGLEEAELLTIFLGAETHEEQGEALRAAVLVRAPRLEVELLAGGQPHYHFIMALE